MTQRLDRAIADVARHDDERSRGELYEALKEGSLLVPVQDEAPGDQQEASHTEILCVYDDHGHYAAAGFTSEPAVTRWQECGLRCIRGHGRQLFERLAQMPIDRLYLNWGSWPQIALNRGEIEALAQGRVPRFGKSETFELPDTTSVRVSIPYRPMHPEVRDTIKQIVASEPEVAFAYLPQVEHPRSVGGQSETLVLVPIANVDVEDWEVVMDRIGRQIEEVIPEGRPFDIMTLPSEHELVDLVIQTGCVLVVNDQPAHERCLHHPAR